MSEKDASTWVIGVGYLGSRLLAALRACGQSAWGIDVRPPADFVGDAADVSFLNSLSKPKRVYCCQATRGGDAEAYRQSYLGVVEAVRQCCPEAEIIFCSSCSLYGGRDGALLDESSPLSIKGERAEILQAAESAVLAAGGRVARLSALYGEGRSVLLPRFSAGVVPVCGSPQRWLNYVHVDDVVKALIMLPNVPHGVYNVATESVCKADLLQQLCALTHLPIPTQEPATSRRGSCSQRIDSSRLRQLGWCPQHRLTSFLEAESRCHEG
ncbi:MAG: NAD-dependent epimerase/dehydratase family protein [Akkermansia sp.]